MALLFYPSYLQAYGLYGTGGMGNTTPGTGTGTGGTGGTGTSSGTGGSSTPTPTPSPQPTPFYSMNLVGDLSTVSKTTKQSFGCQVRAADGTLLYDGPVDVKGAGNSTWLYDPVKPYNVTFPSSVTFGNVGPTKKTRLLAEYNDVSMARNRIISYIAQLQNLVSPRMETVTVSVNGAYYSDYTLSEKVDQHIIDVLGKTVDIYQEVLVVQEPDLAQTYNFRSPIFGPNYPGPAYPNVEHAVVVESLSYPNAAAGVFEAARDRYLAAEASLDVDWDDLTNGPQSQWDKQCLLDFGLLLEIIKNKDSESHSGWVYRVPGGKQKFAFWDGDRTIPVYQAEIVGVRDMYNVLTPRYAKLNKWSGFRRDFDARVAEVIGKFSDVLTFATNLTQQFADTGVAQRKNLKFGAYTNGVNTLDGATGYDQTYEPHRQALLSFLSDRTQAVANAHMPVQGPPANYTGIVAPGYTKVTNDPRVKPEIDDNAPGTNYVGPWSYETGPYTNGGLHIINSYGTMTFPPYWGAGFDIKTLVSSAYADLEVWVDGAYNSLASVYTLYNTGDIAVVASIYLPEDLHTVELRQKHRDQIGQPGDVNYAGASDRVVVDGIVLHAH